MSIDTDLEKLHRSLNAIYGNKNASSSTKDIRPWVNTPSQTALEGHMKHISQETESMEEKRRTRAGNVPGKYEYICQIATELGIEYEVIEDAFFPGNWFNKPKYDIFWESLAAQYPEEWHKILPFITQNAIKSSGEIRTGKVSHSMEKHRKRA